jgi:monoamine oxidase
MDTPLTAPKIPFADREKYLHVIEQGLEKTSASAKIIIIGAGIAGLSAAYELSRTGHDVAILEASKRAGGRVHTLREPFADDLFGEAGAMRYPPSHYLLMRYLDLFNIETSNHYNFNPDGFLFFNGKKQRMGVVSKDSKLMPMRTISRWKDAVTPLKNYYLTEQAKGNNVWPELIAKYNETSLRGFLVQQGWCELDIDTFGKIGLGLGGYASIMNCSFIEIFRLFLVGNDKYQKGIVGGSDRLTNAFLKTTKDKIHFGAVVKKINQNQQGITVEYENAAGRHHISGDYAICTAPFPMVRFIDIEPGISYGKQRAINELHYFSSTKIFFQCKTRFWEKKPHRTHGLTLTDLPIRSMYFPEPSAETKRGVMIASYTWENESRLWESIAPEERIKQALTHTAKIYPEITKEFEIGASCCWNDPQYFAGGAFAIFAPGQMTNLYPDIVKSEGLLHFAGDHTSYEHGWIEGAIESGLREAMAITQRIKMANADLLIKSS